MKKFVFPSVIESHNSELHDVAADLEHGLKLYRRFGGDRLLAANDLVDHLAGEDGRGHGQHRSHDAEAEEDAEPPPVGAGEDRDAAQDLGVEAAPLLLAVALGLIVWAWPKASVSELLQMPATREAGAPFFGYFFSGLTAMVGFWATLSLNIPDFSRFADSQKSQIWGQVIGLPLTMFLFAGLGVLMTSASMQLVGTTVSDPINLIGHIDSTFWVVVAMFMIILVTISTNTAANIVSPTNDFQNVAPKHINQAKGVILTGLIGVLLMGFELFKKMGWLESDVSVESLYSNWLLGYSSLLGPIAGIMIVDYFLIKKQTYMLADLYRTDGIYPRWNGAGFIAFFVPVGLTVVAITTDMFGWFYDYRWLTGSLLGGLI